MYTEQDTLLWNKWKKSKSKQDATNLVNNLLPLVKNDIFRHSSNIPYAVVEAHAKDLIIQAADRYNPNSGVMLSTFVKSYMSKLNQRSAEWRSPIRIPENRAYKFHNFKNSYEGLASTLDREPTITELADNLKWSQAEVKRFLKEIRGEFTEDRPFVASYAPNPSIEQEMIDFVYHDLSTQEKLLFEYTTGYGGKPKLSNPEIMKRMNVNQNQLSYLRRKLVEKVEGLLH